MIKACLFGLNLIFTSISFAVSNQIDLESWIGDYKFSKHSSEEGWIVKDRPGAFIGKDEVIIRDIRFTRYFFSSHSPLKPHNPVVFSIYRNSNNEYFSFFWDRASLATPENFLEDTFLKRLTANTWISLTNKDQKIAGIFYPTTDYYPVTVSENQNRIGIAIRDYSGANGTPVTINYYFSQ